MQDLAIRLAMASQYCPWSEVGIGIEASRGFVAREIQFALLLQLEVRFASDAFQIQSECVRQEERCTVAVYATGDERVEKKVVVAVKRPRT